MAQQGPQPMKQRASRQLFRTGWFPSHRAPEAGGRPTYIIFSLKQHMFYALKRLICILGTLVGNIKQFWDQYKSAGPQKLTIQQSADEIMGAKVFAKISEVKFFGGFLDFSSITCLSKYFGGQKWIFKIQTKLFCLNKIYIWQFIH